MGSNRKGEKMNPPYLLICVEIPPEFEKHRTTDAWTQWQCLLEGEKKITAPNEGIEKLTENCWLIPLHNGLLFATALLGLCQKSGLPYKCLHLDGKPQPCK